MSKILSKVEFTIGNKEKHKVSIEKERSFLGISIIINIDNKEERKERVSTFGKKRFDLEIGNKENHEMKVEVNIPLFPDFRQWRCEVYIDGKIKDIYHL
ncbi:MAG: hypothetical protein PHD81_04245 [Candidatus Nanoarchaeia archaeon]|nr:hypothetical protein [Candidatus Nanoarchaeia archaeon]MDD5588292.1 hypothetical protein [Candidatus Nanoarchaeia archaeon]